MLRRRYCSERGRRQKLVGLVCNVLRRYLVTDNGSLYVATTNSVTRYDASGTLIKSLWLLPDGDDIPLDDIGGLAVKDKGILSMGSVVHMVEHSPASSPTKIVQTLPPHPDSDPIHALSLSHDSTLLMWPLRVPSSCTTSRSARRPRCAGSRGAARRGVHVPRPLAHAPAVGHRSQIGYL